MRIHTLRAALPRFPGLVMLVLAVALAGGCDRNGTSSGGSVTAAQPASIRLNHSELVVDDGASATLLATVRDRDENALPTPVAWRSLDPQIASVSAGTITANHPGETRIIAEAGSLKAEARVVVRPVPTSMAVVSGDGQTGPVGTPLGAPLVVRVTDRHARGVSGVAVRFVAAPHGGSVAPADVVTDAGGEARTVWTLPARMGTPRVDVSTARVAGSSLGFHATAVAGPVAAVQRIGGDGQSGIAGGALPIPLTVLATDGSGNAVAGAAVTWAIKVGSGSLTPLTGTTGLDGRAEARWTLGAASGAQSTEAAVAGRTVSFGAAAFGAPTVTTGAVQQVTATTARFSGIARANGASSTAWFEWLPDTTKTTPSRSSAADVPAAVEALGIAASPEGLTPATRYFVRAVAANVAGTHRGVWVPFNTLATVPDAPGQLIATTAGTTRVDLGWREVSDRTATYRVERVQGTGWAQIGTTSTPQYTDSGLTPSTPYRYRVRACNSAGCSGYSAEASATTEAPPQPLPPAASTGNASDVTATAAVFAATVAANGSGTQVHFEYGTSATLVGAASTPPQALGGDSADAPVSATVSGLTPGTAYHFQVVATNSAGTTRGGVKSFTTRSSPSQLPDLTINAAVASSYSAGEGGVQVRVTVSRSGGSLSGSNHVRANLYWSQDARWDTGDVQLWASNNGGTPDFPLDVLNTSGSRSVTATITVPAAAAGAYNLIAVVDGERYFEEVNESNNAVSYPVSLNQPGPAINSVSPNPVVGSTVDQPLTLTGTHFLAGATARVWFPGGPTEGVLLSGAQVTVLSATSIRLLVRTGTTAAVWNVQVFNPGGVASNRASFSVAAPAAPTGFTWPTDPNTASNGSYAACGDWPGVSGACFWLSAAGWRDAQPFQKHLSRFGYHLGADWNLGSGSNDQNLPVYALANGVVSRVLPSYSPAWGNIVFVRHTTPAGTYTSMYAHVNWNPSGPPITGSTVARGQQIARIGNANGYYGSAYHLHLEIRKGDNTTPGAGYTSSRVTEGPQAQIDPNSFIATHR